MTPAEKKAREIYEKFLPIVCYDGYQAKQCALICVDEIIKSSPTNPLKGGYIEIYSDMIDEAIEFWQEVKQHLENL